MVDVRLVVDICADMTVVTAYQATTEDVMTRPTRNDSLYALKSGEDYESGKLVEPNGTAQNQCPMPYPGTTLVLL